MEVAYAVGSLAQVNVKQVGQVDVWHAMRQKRLVHIVSDMKRQGQGALLVIRRTILENLAARACIDTVASTCFQIAVLVRMWLRYTHAYRFGLSRRRDAVYVFQVRLKATT